jgi:hypothetical protein
MSALHFDTLKFANRLKAGGIADAHAEAAAETLADAFQVHLGAFATKSDLRELELSLRAALQDQGTRLHAAMHELELRLTVKLGAMLFVAVGALAALLRIGH